MLRHIAAVAVLALIAGTASAQVPADKPIRIVIPYPPGASADMSVRLIGQKVEEQGGPKVIVESRPGGGGTVAAMTVKTAPAEPISLFLADVGSFGVNQTLLPDQPFDREKDFKPVASLYEFPSVLMVATTVPANTVAELVALAKKTPGGLSYASQAVGAGGHLLGAMFANAIGTPMVHVPYRGAAAAVADVAAGNVTFIFVSFASAQAQYANKTVKFLGVASPKRVAVLPDVPTMAEAGYPDVLLDAWFGVVAQAALPDATVNALNAMFTKAARDPAVVERLASQGIAPRTGTPGDFGALIKTDGERLGRIVRALDIKAN
jgi:tripartite-type tricarboxylate transporter receptor subunit TctC